MLLCARGQRFRLTVKHSIIALSHLHPECPPLYLGDTLGNDEGDAVTGTAGYLREIPAEQLQTALQLLMATLNGQSLQAALVTCQETLRTEEGVEQMDLGLISVRAAHGHLDGPLRICVPPVGWMLGDMTKDSPPHTRHPGSKRSCHTRGTSQEFVASSIGGSEPL